MKYIILVLSMLFFTACSPKYKVVKEYHPPKITNSSEATICIGLCESKRTVCKTKCEEAFGSCKVKAHRIAKERYATKMQKYTAQLESYVNSIQPYNYDMRFYHFDYYGYPFYYPRYGYGGFANSLFWYDPMPYYSYAPKPKKPSLEQEKLKAEAEFCDLDCGCSQKFDTCYIGCGGQVVSKKLCIENCP
jgi:hypothetical protein